MCLQALVEGQSKDRRDARKAGQIVGKIGKTALPLIIKG